MTNIRCHAADRVGHIRLERPEALNALTLDMVCALAAHLDDLSKDAELCALVISGAPKAFSAGADLKELGMRADGLGYDAGPASFPAVLSRTLQELEAFPVPVIAAVRGWALAGGLEIVLACDLVVAGRSARFGDAHANYGLFPSGGASVRLPRKIGAMRARHLMFTGDHVDARTMMDAGLVTEVVNDADVEDAARRLAARLATRSPIGLRR